MPTPSNRMGLLVPSTEDRFSTEDIRQNWLKIDAAPGTHICTSQTRPTWSAAQASRKIFESDTSLGWVWTGNGWQRENGGRGGLTKVNGTPAVALRDENYSTTSTTFKVALSLTNVVVPDGHRSLLFIATWPQAENPQGPCYASIFQSSTANSGPRLANHVIAPATAGKGTGGNMIVFDKDGLDAGTYDFSLQLRCNENSKGTATIYGGPTTPISLAIIEL